APQADRLPAFDRHAPLLSLPRILGAPPGPIPPAPYLRADPALAERWRDRLAALPGLKVGIAWQGSPKHPKDRQRSVPLERFAPLARVPGVTLLSLQKGHGCEQLAAAAGRLDIPDLGSQLEDLADAA